MQYTTLALGSAIVLYVLYTLVMTLRKPDELIKLKYMRSKFGQRNGTTVHTIVYVLIPLIFAYFMLSAGFRGETIPQFITQ